MFRPFKPPSFLKKSAFVPQNSAHEEPPRKRQRTDDGGEALNPPSPIATATVSRPVSTAAPSAANAGTLFRSPLQAVSGQSNATDRRAAHSDEAFYNVLWRKPTAKKNKTWDSDGILRVADGVAHLQDAGGKELGKTPCKGPLLPGSGLKVGSREVEVESLLSRDDYQASRPRLGQQVSALSSPSSSSLSPTSKSTRAASASDGGDRGSQQTAAPRESARNGFKAPRPVPANLASASSGWKAPRVHLVGSSSAPTLNRAASQSSASKSKWKNPLKEDTVLQPKTDATEPTPRHDPKAPDALVLPRPRARDVPHGKQVVDVVVDPLLARKLRPHQREGVKFLYECVMGFRTNLGQGAILADDMGLGKTLQTITLIWTLLKQNPIYEAETVIRKALIVCPVTLIKGWRKEFRKWLGAERVGVFVAEDRKQRITDFTRGRSYSVMIIGYERLRSVYEDLQKGHGIDLIIADEGQRLKTAQSKSAKAIQSLSTPRRVILSGTPIQNDLGEFFSMVDFVNPGALGPLKAFARTFENPIERSRQPEATEKEIEKGESRAEELADITKTFILRRTAEILSKYLPPKTEYVLMCKPTAAQASAYKHVLASPVFQSALGSSESALQLITLLKKVCNSPKLLAVDPTVDLDGSSSLAPAVAASIPAALLRHASASAKLRVLDQLLETIRSTTDEKVVLVSNFTSTLDVLGGLLTSLSLPHLRLDGSTPAAKRQDLVDTFNRTPASAHFAFLLSAKAGGMGLNLIGASRLVLFDVDWNPAIDAQAMARIHRDGQTRPCVIYRLLLAGALDEKIWQRQVTKLGLASNILDGESGTGSGSGKAGVGQASFSREELRDLFRLDEGVRCQTHELIKCSCGGKGGGKALVNAADGVDITGKLLDKAGMLSHGRPEDGNDNDDDENDSDDNAMDSDLDIMPARPRRKRIRDKIEHLEQEGEGSTAALARRPKLMKGSEVDMDLQERLICEEAAAARHKRQGPDKEMASLFAYSHVDTSLLLDLDRDEDESELLIADEVLGRVVADEDNLVSFIFAKGSG